MVQHILGYKVLFYYHLPYSLARAEKELFSRDIGILRGQIKTTLWLSDAAAAGMNSGTKGAVYE